MDQKEESQVPQAPQATCGSAFFATLNLDVINLMRRHGKTVGTSASGKRLPTTPVRTEKEAPDDPPQ
jgi:hypothetical protein